MAGGELEQQRRVIRIWMPAIAVFWFFNYGRILFEPMSMNPDDERIRESAWAVILVWAISAGCILLHRMNPVKFTISRMGLRILYSIGLAAMLLHLAVAYHLGHEWSHAHAFDHTERISGFGPGIFVSYIFVLVWFVEVVWMWVAFDFYLRRRAWLHLSIVGFMWFILFNATVVYGHGFVRWVGLLFLSAVWVFPLRERFYRTPLVDGTPEARGSGSTD